MPSPATTRVTLLETALRLLEEHGPAALRVRDLAAAAGQSTMGVYHHFGSKQGLLEQLYLHGFDRLADRLNGVPSGGRGRDELLDFALAYRGFAVDNEALYGLMFERATQTSSPQTPVASRDSRPLRCSPPESASGGPTPQTPRRMPTSSGQPCTAWSRSS